MEHDDPQQLKITQERAIIGLLRFPTMTQAAQFAQVSTRTLRRWRQEPEFLTALEKARKRASRQAAAIVAGHNRDAIETLIALMGDPALPPATRVSAARAVMRFTNDSIGLRSTYEHCCTPGQAADAVETEP